LSVFFQGVIFIASNKNFGDSFFTKEAFIIIHLKSLS